MLRKTLWIAFDHTPADLIASAKTMGASAVAVRTANPLDAPTIQRYHDEGLKVFGWLYPAVVKKSSFKYALDEADYVAQKLVPAGLDGYFFDPEGSDNGNPRNWDQTGLESLAQQYCERIKAAVPAGRSFLLGLTSHYLGKDTFPHLPWNTFVSHCDIMLPQSYWRYEDNHKIHDIGKGPKKNVQAARVAWSKFAAGKKILPMAGELALVTLPEILTYAETVAERNLQLAATDSIVTDLHFYTDTLDQNKQIFRDIGIIGHGSDS